MPASDLISRAARFFVLAEQSFHLRGDLDKPFWELSAPLIVETAHHLPSMAAAVKKGFIPDILRRFASQPLPAILPPEAVRWHERLVAVWEVHRTSNHAVWHNIARLALVRLDGCGMPDGQSRPSRLPEWLAEARRIASGEWRVANDEWEGRPAGRPYPEMEALATLAVWRPAPRVINPPETLRAWVNFWLEIRQSKDPVEKGLAAIALLNLPEAELRAASIPPVPAVELLPQVTTAIEVAAERKDPDYLSLLDWQPVEETTWPAAEVEKVAQTWLEVTKHKNWRHRCTAWRQLIRWDRAGRLAIGGMDLLPELVQAVPTEGDGWVLWEMAQWLPAAELSSSAGTPGRRSLLQQLEGAWERYRTSGYFYKRASGWLAGIRLHQAGLAAERTESFLNAYLSNLVKEWEPLVVLILAQWSPGAEVSGRWRRAWDDGWQRRLLDEDRSIRQIAAGAWLRQSLKKGHGRSLRCPMLELWRAGTKTSSEVRPTLAAVSLRFQQVRACLAAGEVVDFEEKPVPPAERSRPPLALPPGRIAGTEWQMENEEWKMENGKWRVASGRGDRPVARTE